MGHFGPFWAQNNPKWFKNGDRCLKCPPPPNSQRWPKASNWRMSISHCLEIAKKIKKNSLKIRQKFGMSAFAHSKKQKQNSPPGDTLEPPERMRLDIEEVWAKIGHFGQSLYVRKKSGGQEWRALRTKQRFWPGANGFVQKKKMSSLDSKKLSISFFRQSLGGWVGLIVRPIHQPAWKGFEGRVHMQGMLCSGPLVQDGGHQPPKPWHWQNELLSACLPHHPRSN